LDAIAGAAKGVRNPLPDLVAGKLREAILSGRLAPGTRIRQEMVAEQFGTSRIPVREALRQLATEGLIILQPDVGARVAPLALNELVEVYMIRERLEPLAIGESAPNLSDDHLTELGSVLKRLEGAVEKRNPEEWLEIDRRFHSISYSGANWGRLLRMIEGFWDTTRLYRHAYAQLPHRVGLADYEHSLILEALQRRDGIDAAKLLEVHIRRTRVTLLSKLELFEREDEPSSSALRPTKTQRRTRSSLRGVALGSLTGD